MIVEILNDVVSYGKVKTCYAKRGEKLQVLNQRDEMLIVKGSKENFPINRSKVKVYG